MNPAVEPCLEDLQLVEAGTLPRVETALLRDALARNPEREPGLAEVNAYKHRLNALRCENHALRVRMLDLQAQMDQMRETRGWKLLEKVRWWRRTVSGWFRKQNEPEA